MSTEKQGWRPQDYIIMGIVGLVLFGLPGITQATGNNVIDGLLAIAGLAAAVSLVIGVIALAIKVGRRD